MQQRGRVSTSPKHRHYDEGSSIFERKGVGRIIGIAVAVFLVANAVIFLLLTSFNQRGDDASSLVRTNATSFSQSLLSANASGTSNFVSTNPEKKGLYKDTPEVLELWSLADVDSLIKANTRPTVIVFYASWCPHCRHFAPKFAAFAKKVAAIGAYLHGEIHRENLSKQLGANAAPFDVTFAAIDCPQATAACDRQKIAGYPTVVAFHFADDTRKELGPQTSVGSLADVDKLLRRTVFTHGELDDARLAQASLDSANVAQLLQGKRSHAMAASHRLDDAWASFAYFLRHELPADEMTAVQVETLRRMMALFRRLFASSVDAAVAQPSTSTAAATAAAAPLDATVARLWLPTWRKRLQFLADCDVVFQKYAQRLGAFPAAKVADVVQRHLPDDQIRWRGCGVPVSGAAASSSASASSSSFRSMFAALQGADDPNGGSGSRDVAGYSCGLWMMFHAFSVVGEQRVPLPPPLTATATATATVALTNGSAAAAVFTAQDVRTVVHDFVGQFFRCLSCRSHFLHSYDRCFFHHCRVLPPTATATGAAEDFAALQLWLFQLHNLVACRVVLEKDAFLNRPLSSDDVARVLTAKLWPTRQQCGACYLHRDFSLSLETFRQKVARRRDFAAQAQPPQPPQTTNGTTRSVLDPAAAAAAAVASDAAEAAGHLRGPRRGDERWLRFASEEDVEWFLLHLVEHAFARDAVLRFLREAYRFP